MSWTKTAVCSLARRWLFLHDELAALDREFETLVAGKTAGLHAAHGIATMTIADMLVLIGHDPGRIRPEAALARLCGVCPIPASSGRTHCSNSRREAFFLPVCSASGGLTNGLGATVHCCGCSGGAVIML